MSPTPARPPARSRRRITTASSGLVRSSARSASRTRRPCAGWPCGPTTSARPNAAVTRGAYVSMSGHMTSTSRGSSVGSSASRPSSTSRSTSTCRAGPWQACTWTERSAGSSGRAAASPTASARRSCCSIPSRVDGGSASSSAVSSPAATGSSRSSIADRVRCSSRVSRPSVASSRCPTRSWERSAARSTGPPRSLSADHSGAEGCGSHRCTSRCVPSAPTSSTSLAARRVCPNRDRRAGRSNPPGSARSRSTTAACRTCGGSASTRSARARHSGGCHARSAGTARPQPSVSRPAAQSATSAGRWAAYPAISRASRRATESRRPRRRSPSSPGIPCPRCWASSAAHGSSRLASIAASSGQVSASGAHGSSSRVPVTSANSERGERRSTPAHTPSSCPAAPRRWLSRCASQRSTPRAGTTTTSVANGSSRGAESRSPSPRASRSVRGAR